jgi:hypothetical protein
MSPELLPRMSVALDEIADGRPPDSVDGEAAHHRFAGFSVLVPAARGRRV